MAKTTTCRNPRIPDRPSVRRKRESNPRSIEIFWDDLTFVFWRFLMDRLKNSCEFNMDTACVEMKFANGNMIAIDTIAVENEVANNLYQRFELSDLQ
jgi:hypothetical protein